MRWAALIIVVAMLASGASIIWAGASLNNASVWGSKAIEAISAAPPLVQLSTALGILALTGVPTLGALAFGASAAGRLKRETDGIEESIRRFRDLIVEYEADTIKLETLYATEAPAALMKPRSVKMGLKVEQVFAQFGELSRQLAEALIEQPEAEQRLEFIEVLADLAAMSNPSMARDETLFQRTQGLRKSGKV